MKKQVRRFYICLGCGREIPYNRSRKLCPYCGNQLVMKVTVETPNANQKIAKDIAEELMQLAQKLEQKAQEARRAQNVARAIMLQDLARYLKEAAEDFKKN